MRNRSSDALAMAVRHPVRGLLATVAGFVVVLVLAYWVEPFPDWDEGLLLAVRAAPGTVANDIAFAVLRSTTAPAQVGWAVLAALLALRLGSPRRAFAAVAEIAGAGATVILLKLLLEHPRFSPAPDDPFFWHPVADSFPSGNSAGAAAIAIAFLLVVPRRFRLPTATAGVAFAVAVAVGLLVLDYHFPSDILGGWLVALGWGFGLLALRRRARGGVGS